MKLPVLNGVANLGLATLALGMLVGPLVLGQMLLTGQSGALGAHDVRMPGATTSATVAGPQIAVYPNVSEFVQYAQFSPSPQVVAHLYQSAVTFTAFAGQQASYNGLMTIYNTGTTPLHLQAQTGALTGNALHSRLWLTLGTEAAAPMTLLTQPGKVGDTSLLVADSTGLTGTMAVVGTDIVTLASHGTSQLNLLQPLARKEVVGEKVYYGPALYLNGPAPIVDTTQAVLLQPQQKATLNLVVATDPGLPTTNQLVIPITLSAK